MMQALHLVHQKDARKRKGAVKMCLENAQHL